MSKLPDKAHFSPKEVADYLSVCIRTVYAWIDDGSLENVKRMGKKGAYRIPKESIIAFEEKCKLYASM